MLIILKLKKKLIIEARHESDHIVVICDWLVSSALNCCFLSILFNLNQKDHTRRKINSKESICKISIIILISPIFGVFGSVQQKIKFPSFALHLIILQKASLFYDQMLHGWLFHFAQKLSLLILLVYMSVWYNI